LLLLKCIPLELINAVVFFDSTCIVSQSVYLEWTVVDFAQMVGVFHHLLSRIPTIHQHRLNGQLLGFNPVVEHLNDMIELGFAISCWVVKAIVDYPKLPCLSIDVLPHQSRALFRLPQVSVHAIVTDTFKMLG
jgi:hypothetical protein